MTAETDWPALIRGDDPWALAEALGDVIGPVANVEGLYFCCRDRLVGHGCSLGWSDGTWRAWIKNRAAEVDSLRAGELGAPDVRIATPLHVGFVSIEETGDQMRALRREATAPADPGPARSRIGSTSQVICPIDRVAFRVAPDREGAVA